MSDERPTRRMHTLLEHLREALIDLDHGRLDHDRLDAACADAQALYERLVILRHKAREAQHAAESKPASAPAKEPAPVELPAVRLDTRPGEAPIRQTSLIDAIAETETPPPAAEPPPPAPPPAAATPKSSAPAPVAAEPKPPAQTPAAPAATPPAKPEKPAPKSASLAQKMERAPVGDLHKAIALSQKFWFVAELFAGQRERYEQAIDRINSMKTLEEALAFLKADVLDKAAKAPAADAVQAFTELMERRFS